MEQNPAQGRALPRAEKQAVELMKSAECDIHRPCGPRECVKLESVLASEYRLKIFQFQKGKSKLTLEPIYKG